MRRNLLLSFFVFYCAHSFSQVGIGTNTPNASAKLDITATDKGLLTPRMTASQRGLITSPATGLLVFQTDAPAGFYYYTGTAWISLSTSENAVPAGTIMPYAGSSAPTGWALCDGSAISRTTYSTLFAIVSTTYGSGDGSTTFALPDLRGRTVFGKDNMGGTTASRLTSSGGITGTTLGATGGAQTKSLSTGEMPSHSHTYKDAYFAENHNTSGAVGGNSRYGTSAGTDNDNSFYFRTGSNGNTGNASDAATDISTSSTGSGTAFALVNPGIVLNYIIKL